MTTRQFRVSNVIVEIADGETAFLPIVTRRFPLEDADPRRIPDARVRVRRQAPATAPDRAAVLSRVSARGDEREWRLGRTVFDFRGPGYSAVRDFSNGTFDIDYRQPDAQTARHVLSAFKWTVIFAAEAKGHLYFHASAVHFAGQNILFCGHSGSGKSSCLLRMVHHGAAVISDDSVLFRHDHLAPFDRVPSPKGDFRSRFPEFDEATSIADLSESASASFRGIDVLVFPRIWHNEHTEIHSMAPEVALDRLLRTYLKETEWNSIPRPTSDVLRDYQQIVSRARCVELFAGSDERNGRATLIEGLERARVG